MLRCCSRWLCFVWGVSGFGFGGGGVGVFVFLVRAGLLVLVWLLCSWWGCFSLAFCFLFWWWGLMVFVFGVLIGRVVGVVVVR